VATGVSPPFFTHETLAFFRDLAAHNERAWFEAQRPRFEREVREPCLAFIRALAGPLAEISPHYRAEAKKVGGSLFRIQRDTRFAKDKTPYKTHAGLRFAHAATRPTARGEGGNAAPGALDAPVFYLHLAPGGSFLGGGIWHPQPATLRRIRQYLVNNPRSWTAAIQAQPFVRHFRLEGERLSRPPQGFDPAHPLIETLKFKDFVASAPLSDADLVAPGLLETVVAQYRALAPLMDWLCGALDLDF
jgi:uncharacterized protein (TIGR02453 family)